MRVVAASRRLPPGKQCPRPRFVGSGKGAFISSFQSNPVDIIIVICSRLDP